MSDCYHKTGFIFERLKSSIEDVQFKTGQLPSEIIMSRTAHDVLKAELVMRGKIAPGKKGDVNRINGVPVVINERSHSFDMIVC